MRRNKLLLLLALLLTAATGAMAQDAVAVITTVRSWDFTKGGRNTNWDSAQEAATSVWGDKDSSFRYSNANNLSGEELTDGTNPLKGLAGIYFTAPAGSLLLGGVNSSTKCLQTSGDGVSILLVDCAAKDRITIRFCASVNNTTVTITSDQMKSSYVANSTDRDNEVSAFVKENGNVVLNVPSKVRIYEIKVEPYVAVTNFNLSAETVTVAENKTVTVTATGFSPSNAFDKTLEWTTADENVATVANGVITGVNPGTTTITVTSVDGPSKTIGVTVLPTYSVTLAEGTVDAKNWTISPASAAENETVTLQYTGRLKVKGVKATSEAAPAANPIEVLTYSFDDASHPSGLTAGSRVSFDYSRTSVITNSKFLNAYNNTNGDPGATTVSLGDTDLSGETWTLSFEWAACGGCNSKADHTTLKAGDATLFDLSGNSNWNTTVTIIYTGSDGSKTLPVPGCDKSNRWTEAVGDQYNTTTYWHHIVVTGSAEGVKMTITNSSTGAAVVEDVVLSETNVNPTSLIIEPSCGGGIGIDALSLTYEPTAAPAAKEPATVTTAPTGAAVVGVGKTTALVSGGVADGGTLWYAVTTTNTKPASTDGFSDAVPTAETISASGKVYVWYYVKGDDTHSDSEIAATAIEVPVADVVWDATNLSDLYVSGTYASSTIEGITLSGNADQMSAMWNGYGDPTHDGIAFNMNESGGYTFTAPNGKAFTKIVMKPQGQGGWDMANLGTGWTFNADYNEDIEEYIFTVTWKGNAAASTVVLLKDADMFAGETISYIVFYLSDAE